MPGGETLTRVQLGRPAGGVNISVVAGSLAGLMDVLVDVLGGGQLGDARLRLLVGHLSSCGGEVLIALNRRQIEIHSLIHSQDSLELQRDRTVKPQGKHSLQSLRPYIIIIYLSVQEGP